jgi:hypothetical protein
MEKIMDKGLKFTPTSTVDFENSSDELADVIFANTFKNENGEPIKFFSTTAENGASRSKPENS